jgi:hypothetical protein
VTDLRFRIFIKFGARQASVAGANGEVGVIYERMALRGYGLSIIVGAVDQ